MHRRGWLWCGLGGLWAFWLVGSAHADPCGMVPPAYTGPGVPIERVGPQKTYVFYKNGIESFVIRPGFRGKVSNFGMLIPFPTPPALRKVPEEIFSHIAAAIDPPEVRVYIRRYRRRRGRGLRMLKKSSPKRKRSAGLSVSSVRVIRQEAVGMYQVAVLEAGSPKALKRWMKRHGYKYPKGMDKVTYDYIKAGWCFVAVKTRVASKRSIAPRPGMRKAKARFPSGGAFKGKVQAMGFRFKTKQLVVPMRLSAYNKGRLRNVVYLLTRGPKRIRHIPKRFVVRQVYGRALYRNVTALLPLRVYGGTVKQIRSYRWPYIQRRRNPVPRNGLARNLFASDLLAARRGKLSLAHEERKKVLLQIAERLELRGAHINRLNRESLSAQIAETVERGLRDLKKMTMTVVDGDFPREVLARENLTFARYWMPKKKNNVLAYHAGRLGPGRKMGGRVSRWKGPKNVIPKKVKRPAKSSKAVSSKVKKSRWYYRRLIQLGKKDKAALALKELVGQKGKALPYLLGEAIEGGDLVRRGWSLVAVAEIGIRRVKKTLTKIYNDGAQPPLVRTWSAAAHLYLTKGMKALIAAAPLSNRFPALRRPLSKRLIQLMQRKKKVSLVQLLHMSRRLHALRAPLSKLIMAKGKKPLLRVMTRNKDNQLRRQAAAYLASLARADRLSIARATVKVLRFRPGARTVPWAGGALFVPYIYPWPRKEARRLVGNLIAWHLWADLRKRSDLKRQIHNNIRSWQLARAAGYRTPGWTSNTSTQAWLRIWGKAAGCKEIQAMLSAQRAERDPRYQSVLQRLGCSR